jgi:hypothetical protein
MTHAASRFTMSLSACLFLFSSTARADWDDVKKTVLLSKQDTIPVALGTFDVLQEWAQLESGPMFNEVMTGRIVFSPKPTAPACKAISYIQIARVLDNYGNNYDWPLEESPRNLIRSKRGYFVDHLASQCAQGKACSPFYRDYWPNDEEGSRDGSVGATGTTSAILTDYPFGWETIGSIELEACAVCRETSEVYGCFNWGGHWGLTTDRAFHPASATAAPSAEWSSAVNAFRLYYSSSISE